MLFVDYYNVNKHKCFISFYQNKKVLIVASSELSEIFISVNLKVQYKISQNRINKYKATFIYENSVRKFFNDSTKIVTLVANILQS